jgi:hypothetical protein
MTGEKEQRESSSERMKRMNADPEFQAKRNAGVKRRDADAAFAAKQAARSRQTMMRLNADPEFARKRDAAASKTIRRLRADPEFLAKLERPRVTKLLDDALRAASNLPPDAQDSIARVILRLVGADEEAPVALSADERAAIAASKAAAGRREFASDEQVRKSKV